MILNAVLTEEIKKVESFKDLCPPLRRLPSLPLLFFSCYFELLSFNKGDLVYSAGEQKTKLGLVTSGKLISKFAADSKSFSVLQVNFLIKSRLKLR